MANLRGERGPQGIRGLRGPVGPPGITTFASDTSGRLFITTDDAGGAVKGDVVRLASVGVLAKAQADSASHAASVIGVYDGANVVPLHAQPIVTFDSAPVPGQPCYLSAGTAGAMTSTTPATGSISMPPNLIVLEDKSVGAAYAARVGVSSSIVSPLSVDQQFLADSASKIGVLPNALRYKFDDFNTLATTGYPAFGSTMFAFAGGTHFCQTPAPSTLDFSATDYNYPGWNVLFATPCSPNNLNLLANAALSSQKWALTFRVKMKTAGHTFEMWLDRGAGAETCGFMWAVTLNRFVFVHANVNLSLVEVTTGQYTDLGPPDTNWHTILIYSTGDGKVHFRLDAGTDYSFAMPDSGSGAVPRWVMITDAVAVFDNWGFCCI